MKLAKLGAALGTDPSIDPDLTDRIARNIITYNEAALIVGAQLRKKLMRTPRIKGSGGDFYHCMSRIVDRQFLLGDVEMERLRRLMRSCETFFGFHVISYVFMANHFHLLLESPAPEDLSDEELLRRIASLYPIAFVRGVGQKLQDMRTRGEEEAARTLRTSFTARMGDVSEFMKTFKQRYTQDYNHRHSRKGTLWEERFKSVLVEGRGETLLNVAAYIDLNPVRAGLVEDPKDYRFSGYGEAIAGGRVARNGLIRALAGMPAESDWNTLRETYRIRLYLDGEATEARQGFSVEQVRNVLKEGGQLGRGQLLRCRVRYFSDGLILGSQEFVQVACQKHHAVFGDRLRNDPQPVWGDLGDLCTARSLRRAPLCLPVRA